MKKVATFGEIMMRLSAPDYLRLAQCNYLNISYAGTEANVAVSLSNYNIPTEYITYLPNNPTSLQIIQLKCVGKRLKQLTPW